MKDFIWENRTVLLEEPFIYWIILLCVYVVLYFYEIVNKRIPEREQITRTHHFVIYFMVIFSMFIRLQTKNDTLALNVYDLLPFTQTNIHQYVGTGIMIYGLLLITIARVCLDGLWGSNIYKYKNPYDERVKLVKYGIYGWSRHPMYEGQVIMCIGTAVYLGYLLVIIFPIALTWVNINRAKEEDIDLKERFGAEFEEYKKKIKPILLTALITEGYFRRP